MTEEQPLISLTKTADAIVIAILRKSLVDQVEIAELGEHLKRVANEFSKKLIVLNFAEVEFMSSSALGAIIEANTLVKSNKGELRLANLSDDLKKIFVMTKLDKVIRIDDDYWIAVQSK
ncbi:MAG: STAS domain-containing protein [Planctomycetota bacterium]|nr:STAS domain-containing protein [Planctomycetota bacterium]